MKIENIPYSPFEEYIKESKPQSLRYALGKYVYHWPLFMASMLFCLFLAFVYLQIKTPGYTVKARLLIKDEEKGNAAEPALKELNMFKSGTLVENELEVLKSRSIMSNVVKDLQLYIDYKETGFRTPEIYSDAPVQMVILTPLKKLAKPRSFEIIVKDQNHFILREKGFEREISFASRMRNNFGIWKLIPTSNILEYSGKTINVTISDPEIVIDGYVKRLNAEIPSKNTTVIELSIKETTPERGKDILNSVIKEYNNAAIDDKNKVRQSTLDFIDTRLSSLTGELNSAEKSVEGFKSSKGIMDISSESSFFLENVKNNDAKLNEVNVQLEVVNGIERYINSSFSSDNAPATAGITDPGLIALINQLISQKLQRTQMMSTTPEGSPVFEAIDRQISTTKHSIRENINGIKSGLLSSRNRLQSFNSGFEASIKQLPGQEREFITMKRQQSIKEELYIYLLQKREEAAVSYASTIADSRTVDQAYYGSPDSPVKIIVLGVGFIAGLLIPLGLITGRELMNDRISSTKEIQDETPVPILGELAYQESKHQLIMQHNTRSMIAEQFRSLRTNLQFIDNGDSLNKGRITLLTSGMSGEGKSFVTSNLATALAASGHKTVVLELDMRNPMIFKYFKIEPGPGISNYLNKEVPKEDIIRQSSVNPNLFVAGAGTLPTFPSELLEKPEMKELIEWLAMNFDEVLIDTPPIQLVTDAMILSRFSDVNLYIVRHRYTYKSHLEYINQLYRNQNIKNLNIVFNGVETERLGTPYQYNYYASKNDLEYTGSGFKNLLKRF